MNTLTPIDKPGSEEYAKRAESDIDIFPWDAHFETGIGIIDEQHQQLVAILNTLGRHVANERNPLSLPETTRALVDYANYHFETEEKLWNQYIPDHELNGKHHQTHQKFIAHIQQVCATAKDDEDCCNHLLEYLTRWLAYHILDRDRRTAIMLFEIRDKGASLENARQHADQIMTGVIQLMIQSILRMYAKLSTTSLRLLREQSLRDKAELELQRIHDQHLMAALEQQAAGYQADLKFLAYHDRLTGLRNFNGFIQELRQLMEAHCPLAVISLDLDNFRQINSQAGTEAADRFLCMLAQRWQSVLGHWGVISRTSGDEFLVLLNQPENLNATLGALRQTAEQGHAESGLHLTASFCAGISRFPQDTPIDPDRLVQQANHALYQAKQSGRQQTRFFDEREERSQRDLNERRSRLQQALKQDELVLHYQPKVHLSAGQVLGYEALIRWQHPERGLLAPAHFLPLVEDHPLGIELGLWVMHTALAQMARWHDAGKIASVSINIAPNHLQSEDFPKQLADGLARHPGLPPALLDLEILETLALNRPDEAISNIKACQALGVSFSLDDFGTGYSSLSYLKQLPIQTLKIDQSFVRDIGSPDEALPMLEAILGMARAFGMQVVAEGIETELHGSRLLDLGCQIGQGYAIARPMPAEAIEAWEATWQLPPTWSATSP